MELLKQLRFGTPLSSEEALSGRAHATSGHHGRGVHDELVICKKTVIRKRQAPLLWGGFFTGQILGSVHVTAHHVVSSHNQEMTQGQLA